MTEREQFEKALPVPDGAVWWDVIEAYCRKNKTTVHQYNDKWQAWQAARAASPKVPQGVEEWIAAHQFDVERDNANDVINADDLRKYLSGMALVPVEPTKAMLEAGADEVVSPISTAVHKVAAVYKAMLAAAKEKGE